ncbi:5550_t:CDS:2 [Paraglomus occultum]|uniref:5550_t:CDS:1 n=1 Tax=Paraglomus occultum TaxID=144539 RepID=A0A9N9GG98_9GLOM|nr:5550_t:CDS:2 [Paraglomus occultum]
MGSQDPPRRNSVLSGSPLPTTPSDEPVFSSNIEDYDILAPIGYGSSAVVYNAIYKPLNKQVAVKTIDLDRFERNQIDELRRETQVMSLSKHENVLRVHRSFVHESKLYIITPFMAAGSCLDIMKTAHPDGLEEAVIATILKQALQGLAYLHKNGHIHRDVKAGNLLMDSDGSVLLADFGVSSSLMENGDRRGYRKTFVGTPCWMAPEVMEQAGYDYKADIWSFGITAIELATGHAPFSKYPPLKVLMLTISNDPPTLDRDSTRHKYNRSLKEMIDACLQKDPTKRPSTEKLLTFSFFKHAKKKEYLVSRLLANLTPLQERPHKRVQQKPIMITKSVSWEFDFSEGEKDHSLEDSSQKGSASHSPPTVRRVSFVDPIRSNSKSSEDALSTDIGRRTVSRFSVVGSEPGSALSSSLPNRSFDASVIMQSALSQSHPNFSGFAGVQEVNSAIQDAEASEQVKGRFTFKSCTRDKTVSNTPMEEDEPQMNESKAREKENLEELNKKSRFEITAHPTETEDSSSSSVSAQSDVSKSVTEPVSTPGATKRGRFEVSSVDASQKTNGF